MRRFCFIVGLLVTAGSALVAEKNVRLSMIDIRERSPILREMEEQGQIKIAGAMYNMKTGAIDFLD